MRARVLDAERTVVTVFVPLAVPDGHLGGDAEKIRARIAAVNPRVEAHYELDLLPIQRWVADHSGKPRRRTAAGELHWRELLYVTEVALGFPGDSPEGLADLVRSAPDLRWVQGTAAGMAEQVRRAALSPGERRRIRMTTGSGPHALPLAEFALFGLLAFAKDADRLNAFKAHRRWPPRWPMRMLAGQRIVVVGLGTIGREVAGLLHAAGCEVEGVRRRATGRVPGVTRLWSLADLSKALSGADGVVLALPDAPGTVGLVDAGVLAALPPHAVIVNVGRGTVVDEEALATALSGGRLRGAALDVTAHEPLPVTSLLWQLPQVLISPHTAALTMDEDEYLLGLFVDNLSRYLEGRPLRNRLGS